MRWWNERAAELQRGVKSEERSQLETGIGSYTDEEARQAVVHARQDIVMVYSLLSSANQLLASIRFTLIVLTLIVIAVIVLKVAHYW
jgi:hypothetical protein